MVQGFIRIGRMTLEIPVASNIGRAAHRGGGGGQLGHFAPGPSLKGAPGGPMKGPLNTCLKDRYTLIEQSDLNTLIEQSDLNTLIEQSQ